MIAHESIEQAAYDVMCKAAIDIPEDYLGGIKGMVRREEGTLSCFVLRSMVENWEAASADRRPMCADTGLPRYYVKVGNEARVAGGFVAVERALRSATARATHDVPLRPNRVHPLWRTDHDNNVGINAPEIEWSFEPDADWVEITTVHKGGLFGTDYRMLFPGDGIDGIKRFYLDTLVAFGKRGLACQPAIVGVGLGGSKDVSMVLGKQAACLRTVGESAPGPEDRGAGAGAHRYREQHRDGGDGLRRLLDGRRLPHRGRPHSHRRDADERAHILPVLAPRDGEGGGGRRDRAAHRPAVVHALHAAGDGGVDGRRRRTLARVGVTTASRRRRLRG